MRRAYVSLVLFAVLASFAASQAEAERWRTPARVWRDAKLARGNARAGSPTKYRAQLERQAREALVAVDAAIAADMKAGAEIRRARVLVPEVTHTLMVTGQAVLRAQWSWRKAFRALLQAENPGVQYTRQEVKAERLRREHAFGLDRAVGEE